MIVITEKYWVSTCLLILTISWWSNCK